ncbi:MAG: response regulator [Planctomycetota bacterium]
MLIEPDRQVRNSIATILKANAFETICFDSFSSFFDKVVEPTFEFDLVLTDMMDSPDDGYFVAEAAKRIHPDCRVILMRNDFCRPDDEVPKHVDAVLSKPFKISELKRTIEQQYSLFIGTQSK